MVVSRQLYWDLRRQSVRRQFYRDIRQVNRDRTATVSPHMLGHKVIMNTA
jgi:hypothetical protein